MKTKISFFALLLLVTVGCAHTESSVSDFEMEPFQVMEPPSGSIYQQGAANHFGDRRARNVGDIVTVRILEEASASQEASTETGKSSNLDAGLDDVFGLPQSFGMASFLASGQAFSPTVKGDYERDFSGSGSTVRKEKLALTVSATVVERLPNGNLRIKAKREIKVNREKQFVVLEGMIRPEDISVSNSILSTQIAEARIQYTGKGILGDTQGPGWFSRILDWIWPI
jgi:flagellar L-ring protein precursor FlgH